MVVDAIISAFLSLVAALLTLLPDGILPSIPALDPDDVHFAQHSQALNRVAPIVMFVQFLLATFALNLAMFAYDGIIWIWHQIHGSD